MQIQKLGLEIRKIGSLDSLYKEVDLVLSNNKINSNEINANAQSAAVAHSLQKMISSERYFDICTVKNCAELCQICISDERMKFYRTQHCIYWNEMNTDFRQLIIAMILDDFRFVLNPK